MHLKEKKVNNSLRLSSESGYVNQSVVYKIIIRLWSSLVRISLRTWHECSLDIALPTFFTSEPIIAIPRYVLWQWYLLPLTSNVKVNSIIPILGYVDLVRWLTPPLIVCPDRLARLLPPFDISST
jgi:hypothetical protein